MALKKASILQYTDSKAAEHILTYRSKNPDIKKMVFDIVLKCKKFNIQPAAVWCSRNEEEMQLGDAGSRGPCFPAQELSLGQNIVNMVKGNFNFTIDLMATYRNKLPEKYYSAAWEAESAGKNFWILDGTSLLPKSSGQE